MSRLLQLVLTLLAFALRVYALDAKGLSYDEAATALMARATPGEIITFHWRAAFEHPPLWQLLMHYWSLLAGQSAFALRFLPALAGTLLIPLLFQFTHHLPDAPSPNHRSPLTIHNLLLIIVTTLAPILIYYSQEARMYALVVTLAVAALIALVSLVGAQCRRQTDEFSLENHVDSLVILQESPGQGDRRPLQGDNRFSAARSHLDTDGARYIVPRRGGIIVTFILLHWAMLGLHYYSALLVLAEGLFCLIWLVTKRAPLRQWVGVTVMFALAVAPLLAWFTLAPGFHDTLRMLAADPTPKPNALAFFRSFWREMSFAAVRWEVATSVWGYLWLPLVALGIVATVWERMGRHRTNSTPAMQSIEDRTTLWLPLLTALLPIGLSALFFPSLATRYLLYVVPPLLLLIALGIECLARLHRSLSTIGLLIALVVPALALPHYFGAYQKSAYRDMAAYLVAHRQVDEALLLEAPRQHLLAKYYLPTTTPIYSAPAIDLPPYWPVNAPPVVPEEMDDVIQRLLRDYRGVWLSLTAENEVDPGEFVAKYLTAVAYERDCNAWLDVRLCHFTSPQAVTPELTTRIDALFGGELALQRAAIALEQRDLLVTLHWQAQQIPHIDYRVTLRLLDATGTVVSQRDNFPIGPLLPPTTWQTGDEKPGYMALPLPAQLVPGSYQVTVNLYDPVGGNNIPHATPGISTTTASIIVAILTVNGTIELHHPR